MKNLLSLSFLLIVGGRRKVGVQGPSAGASEMPARPTINFRCPSAEADRKWPKLYEEVRGSLTLLSQKAYKEVKMKMALAISEALEDLPRAFNCSIGISASFRVLAYAYAGDDIMERADPMAFRRLAQVGLRFMHVSMNWLTHAFVIPGKNDGHWVDEADWPITIQEMNDAQTKIQDVIESSGSYGHQATWVQIPSDYRDYKLKIGIVTMCDYPEDNVLPRYSISNNDIYSRKHGYEVVMENRRFDASRPHAWAKIALIEKHIRAKKYDWLLWFDCDSYFMNIHVTLDHILYKYGSVKRADGSRHLDEDFHMLVQEDHAMLNTGVFFVRTSLWGLQLMQRIYGDESSPWINHPWWENAAFSHEFLGRPERAVKMAGEDAQQFVRMLPQTSHKSDMHDIYPPEVRVAPQIEFNSYHPITSRLYQHDTWEEGKFVLAFSGCTQGSSPTVMQLVYGNYYRIFCEINNVQDQCIDVVDPPIFPWTTPSSPST